MTAPRIAVAIIGAGPAGLAAAETLAKAGVGPVHVLEREPEPGGIPRHCAHSPFGMREFGRPMGGRAYAAALAARAQAAGAALRCATSVVSIDGDALTLTTPDGGAEVLHADQILLAAGAREETRAARLIGGSRPGGVLTTGALQRMVHERGLSPFRRPVIVGTELVAFSALLTCRGAGARPVAMLEQNARITARAPCALAPRALGVPLLTGARLVAIHGGAQVEAVEIAHRGQTRMLEADGVVLTGRFRPENALARMAGLTVDPASLGPEIDQWGRTSAPHVFAAGNALRGVETAGWCWAEGRAVARAMLAAREGALPDPAEARPLATEGAVAWAVPQRIAPGGPAPAFPRLQLRLSAPRDGTVRVGGESFLLNARPERRVTLPLPDAGHAALAVTPFG